MKKPHEFTSEAEESMYIIDQIDDKGSQLIQLMMFTVFSIIAVVVAWGIYGNSTSLFILPFSALSLILVGRLKRDRKKLSARLSKIKSAGRGSTADIVLS